MRWFFYIIRNRQFSKRRKIQILFGLNNDEIKIRESGNGQYIYALIDPITQKIAYVGRSNNPGRRFVEHFNEPSGTDKGKWIDSLKSRYHMPYMIILEQCDDDNVHKQERYWIKRYGGKRILKNMTEG